MRQPQAKIQPQHARTGMSLLEVIFAVAVAGSVLAAAVSLLVSISDIWSERSDRHFFVDHVDGVTEFLNATFATAGVEISTSDSNSNSNTQNLSDRIVPETNTNDTLSITTTSLKPSQSPNVANRTPNSDTRSLIHSPDNPVNWAHPPGFANYKQPLLNFKLRKAPPLLVGLENAPLLGINVYLYFDASEGLSLLWYSILQEKTDDINDLRRTTISSLVTDIHYIYWDESFEKWEQENEPIKDDGDDQYLLPHFIKLTFEYEGVTQMRTVTIPVPSKSALIY
jgi:hypothetical protein